MTYLSGKTRTQRKYFNMALGAVAFALFIYFWPAFKAVTYPLVEPLVQGYGGTKGTVTLVPGFVSTYLTSRSALFEKTRMLEAEVERLENQVAERDAIIKEQALIASSSVALTSRVILMYPVAQDSTRLYSTILLSKGFRDGIEQGGLVFIRGQQPVCDIVEVYDQTSLCELLSKGGRLTEGFTASSSIALSLKGEGGGSFIAEVPNNTPIIVGEDVYLRSDQAYKLGTIVAVLNDEQATGATVYVKGMYNPVTSSVFYFRPRYAP